MVVFLVVALFSMLLFGVPIFMSLTASSSMALLCYTEIGPTVMAQNVFAGLDKFGLMAMPLFMFCAQIMLDGGIARRLLDFIRTLVNRIPGGVAFTAHFSCMFFGALSGSSPATVSAIGGIMYPELLKDGYGKRFSLGLISSSAAVAILIPPSVTMVLYGVATGVSVGALFMGGIGAGILWTLISAVYIYFWVKKRKMQTGERATRQEVLTAAKRSVGALGVPVLILGGIYAGIFTATEAAAVATVYSIIIAMLNHEMSMPQLFQTAKRAAASCAQVMILTSAAVCFGWLLTVAKVPQNLTNSIVQAGATRLQFLLFVNVLFLIAGMFMDGSGAVSILAPLVYPIGIIMGVDPVHLGVVITANLAIGMITPPVGLNLFVANSLSGVPILKMMRGVFPFLICDLIALLLMTYIPEIIMFVPNIVY